MSSQSWTHRNSVTRARSRSCRCSPTGASTSLASRPSTASCATRINFSIASRRENPAIAVRDAVRARAVEDAHGFVDALRRTDLPHQPVHEPDPAAIRRHHALAQLEALVPTTEHRTASFRARPTPQPFVQSTLPALDLLAMLLLHLDGLALLLVASFCNQRLAAENGPFQLTQSDLRSRWTLDLGLGTQPRKTLGGNPLIGTPIGAPHGSSRYIVRGYGMHSRTCSTPQIQPTVRSRPRPKPECGTEP